MEIKILKKIMRTLANFQVKHPYFIILTVIIFTILIVPGFGLVFFDTSNENFLPENDPVVDALFVVGTDFGGFQNMNILLFVNRDDKGEVLDLRDYSTLRKVEELKGILEELEYVNVVSTPVERIKAANNGVIPKDLQTIKSIIQDDEQLKEFYNSDFSIMRLNLSAQDLGSDDAEQERTINELNSHIESVGFPSGVELKLWGSIIQFKELNSNISQGLGFTTLVTFIVIFILVVFFFRSIISGFLAIIPIFIAILWTVGTMGYIGLPFTILTSGFIPLVMGLGIDFSIHLIHKIKHLQKKGQEIEAAIIETMEETGEAIFGSTITTAIGFLSLLLASLLVTQRLGMTLTLSITFIFIGCIIIIPPVLLIQSRLFKSRGI